MVGPKNENNLATKRNKLSTQATPWLYFKGRTLSGKKPVSKCYVRTVVTVNGPVVVTGYA